MKRLYLSVLLLLLISAATVRGQAALLVLIFGEKAATENFHFSMKLGATYSIIHGYEEGNNAFSLNFGVVNNIKLSDRYTLIAEFLPFATRRIRNIPVLTTGDTHLDQLLIQVESTDRKLNYIDVPVLMKLKLSERFSISAGPQFSFLVSAEDIYKSAPRSGTVLTTNLNILPELRRFDAGAAIDLMYILVPPKGGKGINLFVRYARGFVGIVKDENSPRYTSSTIQFGATFPFVEKENGPQ
jgi:hypothetical protein